MVGAPAAYALRPYCNLPPSRNLSAWLAPSRPALPVFPVAVLQNVG